MDEQRFSTQVDRQDGAVKQVHQHLEYSVGRFDFGVYRTDNGVAFSVGAYPNKILQHEQEAAQRYAYAELPFECLEDLVPALVDLRDQVRREREARDA